MVVSCHIPYLHNRSLCFYEHAKKYNPNGIVPPPLLALSMLLAPPKLLALPMLSQTLKPWPCFFRLQPTGGMYENHILDLTLGQFHCVTITFTYGIIEKNTILWMVF